MAGLLVLFLPLIAAPGVLWLVIFVGSAIVGTVRDYVDL